MQSTGNTFPQSTTPGLVSTNPFLNANLSSPNANNAKPVIPSFGASSQPLGANGNPYAANTTLPGTGVNSGSTTPGIIPLPNVSSSGITQPQTNGLGITTPLPNQTTAFTFNGINYDASGNPIPTTTNNGVLEKNQNLITGQGGGGGVVVPATSSIQNQINTDQSAVSALQSQLAAQNTYSGGVNANGQTLPGYVPPPVQSQLGAAIGNLASTASSPSTGFTTNQNNSQSDQAGLVSNSGITPTEQNILNQENNLGKSFNISNVDTTALEPGLTIGQVSGQQGALLNAYNTGLQNLQTQEGQAQNQQSIRLGALNNAGGLANTGASNATSQQGTQQLGQGAVVGALTPQSQYGALTNPVTGEAISGGTSGSVLPQSAQTLVNTLAQQVQNGQMTQNQALSELTAYGPAGVSALTQALGPNFSTNNSNNSAATTAQGQQLQTAASSANQALSTLATAYGALNGAQTTGIPGFNGISNSIESFLGSSALAAYKQVLVDARGQLEGVLTATGATTPTDAATMADSYLPDNMTPSQLQTQIAQAQQLIQQKVSSFQSSGSSGTPSSNIYSF